MPDPRFEVATRIPATAAGLGCSPDVTSRQGLPLECRSVALVLEEKRRRPCAALVATSWAETDDGVCGTA